MASKIGYKNGEVNEIINKINASFGTDLMAGATTVSKALQVQMDLKLIAEGVSTRTPEDCRVTWAKYGITGNIRTERSQRINKIFDENLQIAKNKRIRSAQESKVDQKEVEMGDL